jgi:hypothetical protein
MTTYLRPEDAEKLKVMAKEIVLNLNNPDHVEMIRNNIKIKLDDSEIRKMVEELTIKLGLK